MPKGKGLTDSDLRTRVDNTTILQTVLFIDHYIQYIHIMYYHDIIMQCNVHPVGAYNLISAYNLV